MTAIETMFALVILFFASVFLTGLGVKIMGWWTQVYEGGAEEIAEYVPEDWARDFYSEEDFMTDEELAVEALAEETT